MTRRCPCCSRVAEICRLPTVEKDVALICDGCGLFVPRLRSTSAAIAVVREIRKATTQKEVAK